MYVFEFISGLILSFNSLVGVCVCVFELISCLMCVCVFEFISGLTLWFNSLVCVKVCSWPGVMDLMISRGGLVECGVV